ncbi:hypothetical protein [Nocardioides dongkuii]|uniref:hypothetical protein n=1 Tax=Nocardioides dongkuii TaxID=2760089 RepID=UPI0018779C68|nr:hypothetical protein [Nocardioides dongkuii]
MTPERFWDLIGTLGGVADDASCARLEALLREHGEGEEFSDLVEEHEERLVTGCRWPRRIRGSDTMHLVAAAVVAAGRPAYDAVLARGKVDPGQWDWDEAESLLVVGMGDEDDGEGDDRYGGTGPGSRGTTDDGEPTPPLDVVLQWFALPSPERMETADDATPEMSMDFGDDPDEGRVPVHDPDWVAARAVLAADPDLLARRRRVAGMRLGLTVRPVPPSGQEAPSPADHEPFEGYRPVAEPTAYRFEGERGASVVLCVPVTDFPASGSRVAAYVRAVGQLVDAAEAQPG